MSSQLICLKILLDNNVNNLNFSCALMHSTILLMLHHKKVTTLFKHCIDSTKNKEEIEMITMLVMMNTSVINHFIFFM